MLQVAIEALQNILQVQVFLYLMMGVAVGIVIGILPGLGGVAGLP